MKLSYTACLSLVIFRFLGDNIISVPKECLKCFLSTELSFYIPKFSVVTCPILGCSVNTVQFLSGYMRSMRRAKLFCECSIGSGRKKS